MKALFHGNKINVSTFFSRQDIRAYTFAMGLIFIAGLSLLFCITPDIVQDIHISNDKKLHYLAGQIITLFVFLVTYTAIVARVLLAGRELNSITTIFIWTPAIIAVGFICAILLTGIFALGKELLDLGGAGRPDLEDLKYTMQGALQLTLPISVIIAITPLFIPVDMVMQLPKLKYKSKKKEIAYAKQIEKLESYMMIDMDTELPNCRFFDEHLKKAWHTALRDQQSLGLILIEIKGFDAYNRKNNRKSRLIFLKKTADTIKAFGKRSKDLTARCDDNRFALLLFNISEPDLTGIQSRLQEALSTLKTNDLSFRFGHSVIQPVMSGACEDLRHKAEKMLFMAVNR